MAGMEGDMETDTVPAELDSRQLQPESHDKAPEDMEVNLTAASSSQTATEQREASPQAGITSGMTAPASTAPTSTASSSTSSSPYVMATTAVKAFNNPNYSLTIFLNAISDEITEDVFKKMKFICTGCGYITKSKMECIKDTRDLFTRLREGGYIKPNDLLMLQSLLWFSGARDLFKKVVDFASDQMKEPLHLFAPSFEPSNGYKHVKFHLRGADQIYNPEHVQSFRSQVAVLMQVPPAFVFIEGIDTGSLWITLAVPDFLCDTLLDRLEKTPSVLSHWSVVQVALGDHVLDLEGCSLEAELAEEPSPLDKLYQKNRELRALVEDGRKRLAGIEAAFQKCSSAAQDWLQHPDTECQQLLHGLQKLQKSMAGETATALHTMVHQLVEANRLLSQQDTFNPVIHVFEKSNPKVEKENEKLRNEILTIRRRVTQLRSKIRQRVWAKPGKVRQVQHSLSLTSSAPVKHSDKRRTDSQTVRFHYMSISVWHTSDSKTVDNTSRLEFSPKDKGFTKDIEVRQGYGALQELARMIRGICLIFADDVSCEREVSLIRTCFHNFGFHTDVNNRSGLEALRDLLVVPTQVVVWFVGDILRANLHEIVTKICTYCKSDRKVVIINQRMKWHQMNFPPHAPNVMVASYAGDTLLTTRDQEATSFTAHAIHHLQNSSPGQGLASTLLMAAHDSNAALPHGSFFSFSTCGKDIQMKM